MLFNSLEFFFFFLIVYSVYLLLKHSAQNKFLIIASCIFYASWNWKYLGLMFISITTDYFCGREIDARRDPKARKMFLFLSIFVNLSILGFFKYFNFFVDSLSDLLRLFHLDIPGVRGPLNIILPVGISFYTFESLSYTIDVYRGQLKPTRRYWDYFLFVAYFPQLVAGPIMRAKTLLPQVLAPRSVNAKKFYEGGFLFFWGLFEKLFVADNLAKLVNPVFEEQGPYRGVRVLLALYAFAFQIFCDFDGYSNMARGLGKFMGFEIDVNFNLPYFAVNPRQFWKRWHISLSTWLRDYLYIPLGGNRRGKGWMYAALFLTMFLGGLWHGAAWTFVLWGIYQGFLLIVHRLVAKDVRASAIDASPRSLKRALKNLVFFHLVLLGWLFFRAQSVGQIFEMLYALFFNFNIFAVDIQSWLTLAGFVVPLLAIQIWQFLSGDLMILYKQHWLLKTIIYAFMTYLLIGWGVLKAEEFIYFQF